MSFFLLSYVNKSKIRCPQVDRYINILRRLGHENTTIDYLKMDVEGAELQFFEDVFNKTPQVLRNIKQIGMEFHPGKSGKSNTSRILQLNLLQVLCVPTVMTGCCKRCS